MTTLDPRSSTGQHGPSLTLILATAMLVSFGAAMLIISAAYIQDLRTLRELPNLIWAFVCGQPQENGIALPLLALLSIGSFTGAGALWAWRWLSARHLQKVGYAAAALIAVVLAGAVFTGMRGYVDAPVAAPPAVEGFTYFETAPVVADFMLPSSRGGDFHLSDLAGQQVLLFFGYTHCPDICPLTLFEMKRVESLLGEDAGRVQPLFVSVDPARDTPEVLGEFLTRFDETMIGLSGDPVTLAQLKNDYGLSYTLGEPDSTGNYTVEHSTPVYWIDGERRLRAVISYGTRAEQIVEGLRFALDESGE